MRATIGRVVFPDDLSYKKIKNRKLWLAARPAVVQSWPACCTTDENHREAAISGAAAASNSRGLSNAQIADDRERVLRFRSAGLRFE